MDALSDPRAFLSAQDKRAQQLAALGIQESDIGTDIIEGLPKVNIMKQINYYLKKVINYHFHLTTIFLSEAAISPPAEAKG